MRAFLAGIFLHLWLISAAFGGVSGKVESIGFDALIRHDCWVPMVISITSDSENPTEYSLDVAQYDLDGDEVVFSRPITVNPGREGNTFWTYFKPEPINHGLPSSGVGTAADLSKRLRVFLSTPDGQKRLVQISVAGRMPQILDGADGTAGEKLILCVGRRPNVSEFDHTTNRLKGMNEHALFLLTDYRRLPDNAIGYESVDAVVWTDAEADKLDTNQFRALRQYVRGGGKLVILQHAEPGKQQRFAEMLPVETGKIEEVTTLEPLQSILSKGLAPIDTKTGKAIDPFADTRPPYRIAHAVAKPEALIDTAYTWADGTRSPYIARVLYGQGMVAWVAQDLTDPSVRDIPIGWPRVWNRIFDWQLNLLEFPAVANINVQGRIKQRWTPAGARDLGGSLGAGAITDLGSKTLALLSLAFIFFIGYWLIAGPGSYLVLAAKKRAHWNWFIYAAIAIVAVALTFGVTELVLRGSAQIKHFSLVRARGDGEDPARVQSRFGIYLPQDKADTPITLSRRDKNGPTNITPLVVHPRYGSTDVNLRDSSYGVPVVNEDAGDQVSINAPFRSTLKKFQVDWTGPLDGRITGKPIIHEDGNAMLSGNLYNTTGRDLAHVTMVFKGIGSRRGYDWVLYLRAWPKDQTIDLAKLWAAADPKSVSGDYGGELPLDKDIVRGNFEYMRNWAQRSLRITGYLESTALDDSGSNYRRFYPIVSFFDRMAPMQNVGDHTNRVDLLRRGARNWDCSAAVSAGAMVIIAESQQDTVPLPLTVNGDAPDGAGRTFWQFILPADRSQAPQYPSTQESNP